MRLAPGVIVERDRWEEWNDPLELCRRIEALAAEETTLTVYGHNLFFDLQVSCFFYHFPRWGWRLEFIYDEGLTYLLAVRRGKRHIRCVSTTNYFDFSLEQLGRDLGIDKGKVDFSRATDTELSPYCRRDVEICSESVLKYMRFCREHDAGRFSYTKASQAFASYRHRFMESPIFLHGRSDVARLERDGYYGGRTEAFRLGRQTGGPFLFLDINSMYPFVMRKHTYPDRLLDYWESADMAMLDRWLGRAALVADVELETLSPAYPVRYNGKTIFPVGRFRTVLCTGGLERARARGEIKGLGRLAVYSRSALFRTYVDYWYPLKARYKALGDGLYTRIVKLFLNSLYGKFGERRWIEETEDDYGPPEVWRRDVFDVVTGESWVENHLFNVTVRQVRQEEGPKAFVAVAAHVTEYARLLLWQIIEGIGRDRVLYCDTDSVVIRASDRGRVKHRIDPGELGALSVDKSTELLELNGCKDYRTDGQTKLKGVPRRAVELGPDTFEYDQFLRAAALSRLGVSDGVVIRKVVKSVKRVYDKGIVGRDGRVRPFHFPLA